ncbi:putative tetratricopeptide-like helical domain superfamily [Dioscorea sansibarensis]
MEELGIEATAEHCCCVVDLLDRAGREEQAYEFVRSLGDSGDVVGIWGSLLAACKIHGSLSWESWSLRDCFRSNRTVMSLLNVNTVWKVMRERGLSKEPGLSWIEVGDSSHRFMSRDQRHPENEQISSVLQGLISEMKLFGYDNKSADDLCLYGLIDAE